MRNRNRYYLALGVLCALFCLWSASAYDASLVNEGSAYAQDDDPFGGGDETDDAETDDAFGGSDDSDSADSDDPFADDANDSEPFAPSKLSSETADDETAEPSEQAAPAVAKKADASETKVDDERAKYLRAEDVPDELKTEDDFMKTMNSAEKAIMGSEMKNSADLFSAAARISRVGRPLFAKMLVEKALNATEPSPEEAAAALDSLGSGRATYFIALPEVGTTGMEVYSKLTEIARKAWEGEAAIRKAIEQTELGSTSDRAAAILDLRKGGAAAIAVLIKDLIGGDASKSEGARDLLPFFESETIDALIATARGADSAAFVPAIEMLGEQSDLRVGPELLALAYADDTDDAVRNAAVQALGDQYREIPTEAEFALTSYQKALGCFKRTEVMAKTVSNETEIWTWDKEKGIPVKSLVDVERAYLESAARWAQISYSVGTRANALPSGACALALVAASELELYKSGSDSAPAALANLQSAFPNVTIDQLQSAILYAIDYKRCKGALLPVVWLRGVADESIVYSQNEPSAIVKAALCADRRVRFEAIAAIVKWNPKRSYVGSAKVGRMLEWFATSTGTKTAVVASPKLDECGRIGQVLQQKGYKVLPVTTGRDALLAAQGNADVELIVATAKIGAPDARVIAQTLRADVRTSDVTLLIGASEDGEDVSANLLVGREPNAFVYPTPYDLESCSMAVQRALDFTKLDPVPVEIRLAQSKAAARAFLALSNAAPDVYEFSRMNDITRRYLATPSFFDEGLEYAASLKTNYAQNALIEIIGDKRFTIDQRRKALDAFGRQLAANGSLLRGPDVVKMYDRYNASEKEDSDTQRVLSDMLDVYEQATAK